MTSNFFSTPLLVATAVFLGCLVTQTLSTSLSIEIRRIAIVAVFATTFGFSIALFSEHSVLNLRKSIAGWRQLSQAEECAPDDTSTHRKSNAGEQAFLEWAQKVQDLQRSEVASQLPNHQRHEAFSKAKGDGCELRQPGEAWFHYRLRRLQRNLAALPSWSGQNLAPPLLPPPSVKKERRIILTDYAQESDLGQAISQALESLYKEDPRDVPQLHFGTSQLALPEGTPAIRHAPAATEVHLDTSLWLPEDYFTGALGSSLRELQALRLTYRIAQFLRPGFHFRFTDSEVTDNPSETEKRAELASKDDFILTRLRALAFYSPFSEQPLPPKVESRIQWKDLKAQLELLCTQFRSPVGGL